MSATENIAAPTKEQIDAHMKPGHPVIEEVANATPGNSSENAAAEGSANGAAETAPPTNKPPETPPPAGMFTPNGALLQISQLYNTKFTSLQIKYPIHPIAGAIIGFHDPVTRVCLAEGRLMDVGNMLIAENGAHMYKEIFITDIRKSIV